jgi:kynurenine formamidase
VIPAILDDFPVKTFRVSRSGWLEPSWRCQRSSDTATSVLRGRPAGSAPASWLYRLLWIFCGVLAASPAVAQDDPKNRPRFIDHSLLIAPEYPCTWPSYPFPRFQLSHARTIGPDSPFNIDTVLIDGNTGTQLDVPPHSVVRPELKRAKSGRFGLAYTETIEPWQFGGEACVIDVRDLLDQAPNGVSPLVKASHVARFEAANRRLRFGDVALFRSDYTDKYYRAFPAGRRFIADAMDRKAPAYPDPDPECMEFIASRGVMTLGTDSASMGPLPDLAEPTHYAGLKHGMIWTESATKLGELPPTGTFYCMLGSKHQGGPYGECRAFSIVGGDIPARLIESCKNKRAIDLSPTLSIQHPVSSPGARAGEHRQAYLKVDFLYSPDLDMWHHAHLMDSMAGTHLVPPSFALPPADVKVEYSDEVAGWLHEFEGAYGPRGTSDLTTEKIPLDWTCGPARIIDVRSLVGTTESSSWPSSPEITVGMIQEDEQKYGPLKAGEIVIFHTGHLDRYYRPKPDDQRVWTDPLAGKSEGWPAPGPAAVVYLASKAIRCVATDAPDLGGVQPKRALMTYWALGTQKMVGVEFLYNVGRAPKNGYFLFAAAKIRDCHGGPGRAILLY